MQPKPGDAVLVIEGGRSFIGLVSHAHSNVPSHLGEDSEPLLDVVIVDPEVKPVVGSVGRDGMIRKLVDVVHESHEFSETFKKDNGLRTNAEIVAARGIAEWREIRSDPRPAAADAELLKERDELRAKNTDLEARVANLDKVIRDYDKAPQQPGSSPATIGGPGSSGTASGQGQ